MTNIVTEGGVGSDYLIASIFGEEGTALINIQAAPSKVATIIGQQSYSNSHIVSFANILVPFSTNSDTAPSFIQKADVNKDNDYRQTTTDYDNIDGKDFSVVANQFSYYRVRAIDYDIVTTIGEEPLDNFQLYTRDYGVGEEMRSIGFRLPAFYAGWGVDSAGRPVPSIYDVQKKGDIDEIFELEESDDKADIEELEKRKNTYCYGYNVNPSTWVAGPIDLRWDRHRGVWGASPVIIEGYLLQDLTEPSGRATKLKYTSGEILIYTGQHNNWNKIQPEQKAWVINRSVGLTADSGTYIAAMWFPNGEFRPIWVDCEIDPSGSGAEVPSLELADE